MREKCEYTYSKLNDVERYIYNMKKNKEWNMPESFRCQLFFSLCFSLAWAVLPVSGSCAHTAQVTVIVRALPVSSSCHVQLKSLLLSRLSSAELALLAIPSERVTPQSGRLLKVVDSSKWWSKQQPLFWRALHNANVIGLAKGVHGLVQCTCWQTYIYIYIQISRDLE